MDAFEELYRSHAGRVYALCRRLVGDPEQARRLTQDAFVRAWERLEGFRGESAFSTWLHRLTVNVVLADRRRRRRLQSRIETRADLESLPVAATGAGPGLKMDLERAIEALPDGAREVFVLHEVEGFTHEEIGQMAGIAQGTSKAQLHRARALLREMLER